MTDEEYICLKAECDKRGYNITNLLALAYIMPNLGFRKKKYGQGTGADWNYELTYCGKTRKEWSKGSNNKKGIEK